MSELKIRLAMLEQQYATTKNMAHKYKLSLWIDEVRNHMKVVDFPRPMSITPEDIKKANE